MKVQNSCVPTSGRRADNDLNLRHQTNQTNRPINDSPIPTNRRIHHATVHPLPPAAIADAKSAPGRLCYTASIRRHWLGLASPDAGYALLCAMEGCSV